MSNWKNPHIVIVIPCFNESENINALIRALDVERIRLLEKYTIDYILIDDGSTDKTQSKLEKLSSTHKHLYYRSFAYNAGHQSALRAGINASTEYDATIMMDADLQHPPALIGEMLNKWIQGYELVQMTRDDSKNKISPFRKAWSNLYYRMINALSGLNLDQGASDFRLADQSIIKVIASSREQDLFLRGYFSWLKVKRITIKYTPGERFAGKSKYSIKKLMKLAFQGILQFSEKPLRISILLGILTAFLALIYGVWLTLLYIFGNQSVSGWTSLMVVMLFFFGIIIIILGIIGSYLAHLIAIEKQRPEFIIESEKLPTKKGNI